MMPNSKFLEEYPLYRKFTQLYGEHAEIACSSEKMSGLNRRYTRPRQPHPAGACRAFST